MIDLLLSTLALSVLLPFCIPIMLILFCTGEGHIFYRQERIGKDKRHIKLWKFATMLKNSPNLCTGTITVRDDPRILPFGKFLRSTKINELPQLINVVAGDMSLIGPRPLTEQTFSYYNDADQAIISQIRPGLSGLGSVVFRGEQDLLDDDAKSIDVYAEIIAPYKSQLEKWYVKNNNIWTYILLIYITIHIVFFPKSCIIWRIFRNLPEPPETLKRSLNYLK